MQPLGQPNGSSANPASSLEIPPAVPEHRLLTRIGGGSYGEVWLATNLMGTFRAVKVVFRRSFEDERPYQREFAGIRRFEPVSRSHESLVDVLQVGQDPSDEYFYYVMELGDPLEGGADTVDPATYQPRTLRAEIARRGRLAPEECVRLGVALCEGLAHLHRQGLVHRDIKPSNIIFVHDVPKLADIGLVADLGEARSFVGTLGFVPPEGPGSKEADIYSLGKVLYEACTGEDRQRFPALPAAVADAPNGQQLLELSEVLAKACHAEPGRRYHAAAEMEADLVLLGQGKSVRRLHLLERRMAVLTRAGVLVALVLAVAGAAVWGLARDQRFQAELRNRQIGDLTAHGAQAIDQGNMLDAVPFLTEGLRLDRGGEPRLATPRLRIASVLAQCPKLVRLWSLGKEVSDVEFSRDGRQLVTALFDGTVQVYDTTTGQAVSPPITSLWYLHTARLSPDGRQLLTASEDQGAAIWDLATGKKLRQLDYPGPTFTAAYSPDGRWIAVACEDHLVRVFDAASGTLRTSLRGHTERVEHVAFSHNGALLASSSNDGTARLWDLRTGGTAGRTLPHPSWVKYAAFSPDDRLLLTACFDYAARTWDVQTGQPVGLPLAHHDLVLTADFSPDGQRILTAGLDFTARLWDAVTHEPLRANGVLPHAGRVRHAAFSPEGNRIAIAGVDGTVALWDLAGGVTRPRRIEGRPSGDGRRFLRSANGTVEVFDTVSGAPVSPQIAVGAGTALLNADGRFLTRVAADGSRTSFRLWAVATGDALSPAIPCGKDAVFGGIDPSGTTLAVIAGESVELFDVPSGRRLVPPLACHASVTAVLFPPARPELATVAGEAVQFWSVRSGQALGAPLHHLREVTHAEFSRDGRYLVTCCADEQLTECYAQVWDAATRAPVGPPFHHHDGVTSASFSPHGRRVVTAGEDRFATVWEVGRRDPAMPALEHESQVQDAAWSENGRWIVTGSNFHLLRLWEAETGVPLGPPLEHPDSIVQVRFLDADRGLFTLGRTGKAWLWPLPQRVLPTEDLLELCTVLNPRLALSLGSTHPPGSRLTLWKELRAKYPTLFTVSAEELADWHDQQAALCEQRQCWRGALLHLDRLAALRPKDPDVARRRQAAASEAQGQSQPPR